MGHCDRRDHHTVGPDHSVLDYQQGDSRGYNDDAERGDIADDYIFYDHKEERGF